jgi:hypothetical protein
MRGTGWPYDAGKHSILLLRKGGLASDCDRSYEPTNTPIVRLEVRTVTTTVTRSPARDRPTTPTLAFLRPSNHSQPHTLVSRGYLRVPAAWWGGSTGSAVAPAPVAHC